MCVFHDRHQMTIGRLQLKLYTKHSVQFVLSVFASFATTHHNKYVETNGFVAGPNRHMFVLKWPERVNSKEIVRNDFGLSKVGDDAYELLG